MEKAKTTFQGIYGMMWDKPALRGTQLNRDKTALVIDIPELSAVVDPSDQILAVEKILLNRLGIRKFLDLDVPEPSGISVVLEADVAGR